MSRVELKCDGCRKVILADGRFASDLIQVPKDFRGGFGFFAMILSYAVVEFFTSESNGID
jgi:hypothetical protein